MAGEGQLAGWQGRDSWLDGRGGTADWMAGGGQLAGWQGRESRATEQDNTGRMYTLKEGLTA